MIYTRKNKYEVIRIDKILYPVSVAYMSIPPPSCDQAYRWYRPTARQSWIGPLRC